MALSDDVKKVLDDLQVEKRLQEASEAIDRHAGTAVQSLGSYVAAREDKISELIERTAGQVDERTEHRWTEQIDKVTHKNAMRFWNFDLFKHYKREEVTVGALRAKAAAAGVDTSPKSSGGRAPLAPGEKPRPITSGDIMGMFAKHDRAA